MPNWCANKVVVTGPSGSVRRFVEAARGPHEDKDSNLLATELRVIGEVRSGKPVAEAFRDANNRLDAIAASVRPLMFSPQQMGEVALPAVPEDGFEAWAADVRRQEMAYDETGPLPVEESWLSLPTLVPMPGEVAGESWSLAAYGWRLSEWGTKWGVAVGKPDILDASEAARGFGAELDDAVASYPKFDTANSPMFRGLRNASRNHPDLVFVSAFMAPDCGEFDYYACRDGRQVAAGSLDEEDLPAECFGRYEDGERYVLEQETVDCLAGIAVVEAMGTEPVPAA